MVFRRIVLIAKNADGWEMPTHSVNMPYITMNCSISTRNTWKTFAPRCVWWKATTKAMKNSVFLPWLLPVSVLLQLPNWTGGWPPCTCRGTIISIMVILLLFLNIMKIWRSWPTTISLSKMKTELLIMAWAIGVPHVGTEDKTLMPWSVIRLFLQMLTSMISLELWRDSRKWITIVNLWWRCTTRKNNCLTHLIKHTSKVFRW